MKTEAVEYLASASIDVETVDNLLAMGVSVERKADNDGRMDSWHLKSLRPFPEVAVEYLEDYGEPFRFHHDGIRSLPEIPKLNGRPIIYKGDAIFLPLPPELWTESGFATDDGKRCCSCGHCSGFGFWDTLVIARNPKGDYTGNACTVHAPEYHGDVERYRKMAETLLLERGER